MMTMPRPESGLQLFSTITDGGRLELSLETVAVASPGDDEVLIRIEATPINPSDLGLLLSVADTTQLSIDGDVTSAPIPPHLQRMVASRKGKRMPVGNEGAGTVIAAGASEAAQALLGRMVCLAGGQMYAQFKTAKARDCMVLPEGLSAEQGASSFVNPLTALGMIGTMRNDGFTALIHTAAASNLGQMLVKLTQVEGIDLIAIVRNGDQAALLHGLGAKYVLDSTSTDFLKGLTAAIRETGAFLAFDAIGGGRLASQILQAMEAAAVQRMPDFSIYGSTQKKQVYIYGGLNTAPTELTRGFGMTWSVGGWLLTPYLQGAGAQEVARIRQYVSDHLHDIFTSNYTARISLRDALYPDQIAQYNKRATGEKFVIAPAL